MTSSSVTKYLTQRLNPNSADNTNGLRSEDGDFTVVWENASAAIERLNVRMEAETNQRPKSFFSSAAGSSTDHKSRPAAVGNGGQCFPF
jgi:uncharacterized lipoprotein